MQVKLLTSLAALAAPLASAASCSSAWAQCGGIGYSGPTCCADGSGCKVLNDYYSQCVPGATPSTTAPVATTTQPVPTSTTATPAPTTKTPAPTTATPSPTTATPAPTTKTPAPTTATPAPTSTTATPTSGTYLTYDTTVTPAHDHDPWTTGTCDSMPTEACMSGTNWGEKTTVSANEDWHYSRSTHFGLTNAGACGFGMYGLCTKGAKDASWVDPSLGGQCDAFCKAYPVLCQDPTNTTLRGNFAAPDGKYYTQFWPHLPGNKDNYLSCGECFELVRTKKDGTDYQPGEAGYTDPVVLEIIDSCPCNVNQKWCCGSGVDQCQEASNMKYGCPIPTDSTHLDLSDIAMGRLVGGGQQEGVIPTRYRRVSCPKPGNMYIWLRDNSGPYYLALSVVNSAGVGGIAKIDIKGAGSSTWTAMLHDPNYSDGHPQDRYGSWTIPKGSGPFNTPIALRITSPNGEQAVITEAIKSFTAPASAPSGYYYIDLGINFSPYGKH